MSSLTNISSLVKIWDLGPEKAFTVDSRGVFTQDESGYFSNDKAYVKNRTRKKCSLIRGVHYERFHCTYSSLTQCSNDANLIH